MELLKLGEEAVAIHDLGELRERERIIKIFEKNMIYSRDHEGNFTIPFVVDPIELIMRGVS